MKCKLKSAVVIALVHKLTCENIGKVYLKKLSMGEVSYQVHISVETFKQAIERSGIDFPMLHIKVFDNAEEDEGNDMVVDVNEWVIVEFSINTNKKISR